MYYCKEKKTALVHSKILMSCLGWLISRVALWVLQVGVMLGVLWKYSLCSSSFWSTCWALNISKATACSWSTVEGRLQLLHARYSCHSSCSIPSKYHQRYCSLSGTVSYETHVAGWRNLNVYLLLQRGSSHRVTEEPPKWVIQSKSWESCCVYILSFLLLMYNFINCKN